MSKLAAVALCLSLLGAGVSGCSLAGPSDVAFTPTKVPPKAKGVSEEDAATRMEAKMKKDAEACRSVARQKGVRSLLAIVKSVNPENTNKAYIACMKKKGWRVEAEPEASAEETEDPGADAAPEAISPD